MPAGSGTNLLLSNNTLLGPIPAAWSTRASSWLNLNVAGNPTICGLLPTWYTTQFTTYLPLIDGARRVSNLACTPQPLAFIVLNT